MSHTYAVASSGKHRERSREGFFLECFHNFWYNLKLSDKSATVRIAAAKALNRVLGRDCRGIVEPLLSDGEGAVRLTAASILGEYGDKRAIGVLIELLDDRGCAQTAFLLLRKWTGL